MSILRQKAVDALNRLAFKRGDVDLDKLDFDYLTLLMVLDPNFSSRDQGSLQYKLVKAEVVKALDETVRGDGKSCGS